MKRLPAFLALAAGVGVLVTQRASIDLLLVLTLISAFAIVDLFGLTLARGGEVRFDGGLVVAAVGLLDPFTATACFLMGSGLAGLARARQSETVAPAVLGVVLRAAIVALLTGLYDAILAEFASPAVLAVPIGLFTVGVAFMLVDLTLYSVSANDLSISRGLARTGGLVRILGAGYVAQVSVGIVLVQVSPRLGLPAFLVLVPLMLIMRQTTSMLIDVRAAYMRTVGALAQVAEMQTGASKGHARRVSAVSTAIGKRMRIGSQQLERLALASLLHDIGRVKIANNDEHRVVADASAELLSRISFLAVLSPVVRRIPLDYVDFMDATETDGRLARVIRVASDFDDRLSDLPPEREDSRLVLAHLGEQRATRYDPVILDALAEAVAAGEA